MQQCFGFESHLATTNSPNLLAFAHSFCESLMQGSRPKPHRVPRSNFRSWWSKKLSPGLGTRPRASRRGDNRLITNFLRKSKKGCTEYQYKKLSTCLHTGQSVRLQARRSWVRISMGCKFLGNYIFECTCSKLKMPFYCVHPKKIVDKIFLNNKACAHLCSYMLASWC
jgi:hypothetical protein